MHPLTAPELDNLCSAPHTCTHTLPQEARCLFVCMDGLVDGVSNVDILDYLVDQEGRNRFRCGVCLGFLTSPVNQCSLGCNFCQTCLDKWLLTKTTCPNRECPATLTRERNIARGVDPRAQKQVMQCPFRDCEWTGAVGEFKQHAADVHTLEPCACEGCTERVERRWMVDHVLSCGKNGLICGQCRYVVAASEMERHAQVCRGVLVLCHLGCGARHRRDDTGAHGQVCPEMPVECEYKRCGCTVGTLLRKDVAAHERDAAGTHAMLAWRVVKSQEEIIDDLKQRVATLEDARRRSAQCPSVVRRV